MNSSERHQPAGPVAHVAHDRPRTRPRIAAPLTCYLVTTFVASGLLLLVQQLTGFDPNLLVLPMFGPAVGVLVTRLALARRTGPLAPARVDRAAFGRAIGWAVGLVALGAVVLVGLAAWGGTPPTGALPPHGLVMTFVALQLVGAFGEELGWRGFLQPTLERRLPRVGAALLTGAIWAVWHVQNLADPLAFAVFLGSCLALSLAFAAVTVGGPLQRATVAALLHGGVNLSIALGTGFLEAGAVWPMAVTGIALAAVALGVPALARRRRR